MGIVRLEHRLVDADPLNDLNPYRVLKKAAIDPIPIAG